MTERYTGPTSLLEQPEVQAALISDEQDPAWMALLIQLQEEVTSCIRNHHIPILSVSRRLKPPQSIRLKVQRKNRPDWPVADIYGIKIILPGTFYVSRAGAEIRDKYPLPETFPWGVGTARIGRNPATSSTYNVYDYQVARVNVLFAQTKLGEIKLLTPEDEEAEEASRQEYEQNKNHPDLNWNY